MRAKEYRAAANTFTAAACTAQVNRHSLTHPAPLAAKGINPYPVTSILWNRKQPKIVKKNRFSRLSKEIRL